ncbi:MAG: ABC transporter substrate-binding protein [Herpetosiphon sp.]
MNVRRLKQVFAVPMLLTLVGAILAACGGPSAPTAATTAATTAPRAGGVTATTESAGGAATATKAVTAMTAAATTAAATTAATSKAGSATGANVLRIGAPTYPDSLDPQKSSFVNEISAEILNYEGLTRYDDKLKTVPAAAEKWQYNTNASAITFTLRTGLKYSDGSPLTAQDFVNAAYRTLDPRNPGDYQTALNMIKGADAIISTQVPTNTSKLPALFKELGAKAIDERTIAFQFTQPTPFFHTLAGIWVMFPVKQALVDKGGETWWQKPENHVGNGPFQITKIDEAGKVIEYKANANYWGGKPKLDGVQLRYIDDSTTRLEAYKSNELDIMDPDANDIATIKADPTLGKELKDYAGACTTVLEFNLNKPPFNNKKVREAFNYAFDRDSYIKDVAKGNALKTLSWIPPGFPGYDATEKRYDFDAAKAKQTLADAGFPNGKGLPEIKYQYNGSSPANQAKAEYLIQMIQKNLGVTITPDPVEGKTLTALRKKNATHPLLNLGGWCSDYPDQQDWLSVVWNSSQQFAAVLGYKNPEFDKLTNQADAEANADKRNQLYDQAQKILVGDAAQVIISNSKNIFLIKPTVQNIQTATEDGDYPGTITSLMTATLSK